MAAAMNENSTDALKVIEDFQALIRERAAHIARVAEIDGLLAKVGQQIGGAAQPLNALPRLQSDDGRTAGTMSEAIRNLLYTADHGYTTKELREKLEEEPRFAAMLARNMNTYYNQISRLKHRGDIVVAEDGLLYHPARAPVAEGETDPTGQRLPRDNVSNLFERR
jgi:hypothetical protein